MGERRQTAEETEGGGSREGGGAAVRGDVQGVGLDARVDRQLRVFRDGRDALRRAGEGEREGAQGLGFGDGLGVGGSAAYDETLHLVVLELGERARD